MKPFIHALKLVTLLSVAAVSLSACSDFRRAIGTEKSSPDEFAVVVRAPLSLPPDFTLRPQGPDDETAAAAPLATEVAEDIFAQQRRELTGYDELFQLSKIAPDIRTVVDEETAGIRFERRLPIQVLFGGIADVGPVLDQLQEDARLRENRASNLPLNQGASPAIDGVLGDRIAVE